MKQPIKRRRKYNIVIEAKEDTNIIVQANYHGRYQQRMEERVEHAVRKRENVDCKQNKKSKAFVDLESHRKARSPLNLVQLYWITNLAVIMMVFDLVCILITRIALTWMPQYSFLRFSLQLFIFLMSLHLIYCFWIYVWEKRKEANNVE